jgi:4-aminobutyrate aminotransferase-like enzyme
MLPVDNDAPRMVCVPPGPESRRLLDEAAGRLYPGLLHGWAPLVMAAKRGYTVEDVDGNVYVDLISASASVPAGAARPDLIDPVVEAMRRYGNEDSHSMPCPELLELSARLLEIAPPGITRVDLALNGTEAIETALKLMRRATGRPIVIGFFSSYHGESSATAALGAESNDISRGIRQLTGGFVHVPYPHPYRSPLAPPRPGGSGDATVDYIRDHLLFHAVDPAEVAGVVIEPVAGSGGVLVPPDEFWPALRELCDEHGWLLCADEVKTGFGRTGTMLAVERWDVRPDVICLGKAMGGGVMPIGAVMGTERAMGEFDDVPTGSTWSWLPAACAASLATLDLYRREPILENVRALEAVAVRRLGELTERHDAVGDVRAIGCFQAIELVRDRATKERAADLQHALAVECLNRGVLADSSSTSYNIQPSLAMPPEALDAAYDIVAAAMDAVLVAT